MRRIEEVLKPLRDSGEVVNLFSISGFGSNKNSGFMVLTLAPWGERERSQDEIVRDMTRLTQGIPGVNAFAMQPNSLRIRGGGSGLQFALVGSSHERLTQAAIKLVADLEADGGFDNPRLSNDISQAQLGVSIDRERAAGTHQPIGTGGRQPGGVGVRGHGLMVGGQGRGPPASPDR